MSAMKIAGLVLLLMSPSMWAWQPPKQPPYSFKSAVLGMTLEQFKAANSGKGIRIPFSKAGKRGKTIIEDRVVPLPLCSDAYSAPSLDGQMRESEIVCSMSWASEPTDELNIVGLHVQSILYRFRHSLLYQVDITFDSWLYPAISKAFIEKYGTPEKQGTENYQNVFGARWTGNNLSWRNDRQQWIAIVEGPGNGPGQDSANGGMAIIEDGSLAPPTKSPPLDF